MRLSLLPYLRQLWRDPRTVQLGTDPTHAVILEFSDPVAARILELLDGSRSEDEIIAEATSALAIDEVDTRAVLDALQTAGLLIDVGALLPAGLPEQTRRRLLPEAAALALWFDPRDRRWARPSRPCPPGPVVQPTTPASGTPAEALRRRAAAKILLTGAEALVAPIAVTLAGAGVGHVDPTVDGRGRPKDLITTIARAAPETLVSPVRAGSATVVVRIGARPPVAGRCRRAAVLTVGIRDGTVLVGPLVQPDGSPCGHCLDLHRRDRDPAWPVLAAQLATDRQGPQTCALTTAITAAAYAAEEVLAYIDGRVWRTDGATVEITRPGEIRRRSWSAHPRCGCRRRRASPTG